MDEWTEDELYEEDDDEEGCDSCPNNFDDSCAGCPEYARQRSLSDPVGVYNAFGECIGTTAPPMYPL